MSAENKDRDYYTQRAATARSLAENAADWQIANIHHEMADRYDARVKALSGYPQAPAA